MKKYILMVVSNLAFLLAAVSLSQCSTFGGHQPELRGDLKEQILTEKGRRYENK